jgi:hypothetical protein
LGKSLNFKKLTIILPINNKKITINNFLKKNSGFILNFITLHFKILLQALIYMLSLHLSLKQYLLFYSESSKTPTKSTFFCLKDNFLTKIIAKHQH